MRQNVVFTQCRSQCLGQLVQLRGVDLARLHGQQRGRVFDIFRTTGQHFHDDEVGGSGHRDLQATNPHPLGRQGEAFFEPGSAQHDVHGKAGGPVDDGQHSSRRDERRIPEAGREPSLAKRSD